jgi:alkanesulfonate monooxygenase SsuD/methylene tetrahydromethanopterin reductase-like flavin-dependent oxidoreductase (luciferase family)
VLLEDYVVYHAAPDTPTTDPWIALAAMAMATSTIRLGTAVTPLSRRRPWKLAREAASLDQLSGGRMILGVGLGDPNDHGFGQVGEVTDPRQRAQMLDEGLAVITGLWTGEPFTFEGKHYRLSSVTFQPTPIQRPRIPIWVGGVWPHPGPVRRAARWDGALIGFKTTPDGESELMPEDLRTLRSRIEDLRRFEKGPFDYVMGGGTRSREPTSQREHIRSMAAAGATWWMEYIEPCAIGDALETIRLGPVRIDDDLTQP